MQPQQSYVESAQEAGYLPPHLRGSPWRGLVIAGILLAILAAGAWFWWESTQPELQANQSRPAPAALGSAASPTAVQTTAEPEVRKADIASSTESAAATQPPPDLPAITRDASRLIGELFAADTPEKRHACVYNGENYAAEIESLLGEANPQRPKLLVLSALKIVAHQLPVGQQTPLFNLTTSTCKHGALVRLIEDSDGIRRIDWPLLRETHEQTLPAALSARPEEPLWAWGRIMPSHGFELPVAAREQYLTFELHITANGKSPLVACVDRETPLGRYFDRETDWRQSYLVRLLLRKLPLESSTTAVLILDCEGTAEKAARAKSP